MRRIVACNRHITQERLPTSRYVFVLRAEIAGDTSLLFCLVRIVCTECTFFTGFRIDLVPGSDSKQREHACAFRQRT